MIPSPLPAPRHSIDLAEDPAPLPVHPERVPTLYVLHSGNLYGTERMALATAVGLGTTHDTTFLLPPGPAAEEIRAAGCQAVVVASKAQLSREIRRFLARHETLACLATGVVQSLLVVAWNAIYRRRIHHLHMVHGGTDEHLSYGRKRLLRFWDVTFVAVSGFVRERLLAHRVPAAKIVVIENFLTEERLRLAPRRAPFTSSQRSDQACLRSVIVISRVDPIKRVDLLFDALGQAEDLRQLQFTIYGTGWDLDALRQRATNESLPIALPGYVDDLPERLATADLLLHLCPEEPFGLAVLEAMAAGIPVMVPDSGGAGSLIEPNISGFHFRANDVESLIASLRKLRRMSPEQLDRVVAAGNHLLTSRFGATCRIEDYRSLLETGR